MGGGVFERPPLTRLPGNGETNGKQRSKARQKSLRNYFGQFFAQVKNEVTRGHQRSKFRKSGFLSGISVIISGTMIARKKPKKAFDSSGRAPVTFFRQIGAQVNG